LFFYIFCSYSFNCGWKPEYPGENHPEPVIESTNGLALLKLPAFLERGDNVGLRPKDH